jgi:uncharacterized repeat protein (TIGR03803 family)
MPHPKFASRSCSLATSAAVLALLLLAGVSAFAQTESVLYAFQGGNDAAQPQASLVADSAGNLYGTAPFGGSALCNSYNLCGAVFRLSRATNLGGTWNETVIYNFQGGSDGSIPVDGLIFDKSGNLYGTTESGGSGVCGCGTVFKLSPPAISGGSWTKTVLYSFTGGTSDGRNPMASLVFDAKGNLYGTTEYGGNAFCDGYPGSCGTVFQLSPPTSQGGSWTETVIHNFGSLAEGGGGHPQSGLIVDASGALYGAAYDGGNYACAYDGIAQACGMIFRLTPPPYTGAGWKESLYSLHSQLAGYLPFATLAWGKYGKLYGTASFGGSGACYDDLQLPVGCGVVFQVTPPGAPGSTWREDTIYSFTGNGDGANPLAGLVVDGKGNLYGTTVTGNVDGSCQGYFSTHGCGTVFELSPPASQGGSWTETTLHSFVGGSDGADPKAALISDGIGGFYGTTTEGGLPSSLFAYGAGTIFHVVP